MAPMAHLNIWMECSEATVLKALVLWFGVLGLCLFLLGLLGAPSERSRSGRTDPSTYSEPMIPELPTAPESQAEAFQNIPALTF